LAPSIFREILKLPEPNLIYKGEEVRNYLKSKNNGLEILQVYLHDPSTIPKEISRIQVSYLNDPYKEFLWLFM
jgi:hypothetical protein